MSIFCKRLCSKSLILDPDQYTHNEGWIRIRIERPAGTGLETRINLYSKLGLGLKYQPGVTSWKISGRVRVLAYKLHTVAVMISNLFKCASRFPIADFVHLQSRS